MKSPIPEPTALEMPDMVRGPRPRLINILIAFEFVSYMLSQYFYVAAKPPVALPELTVKILAVAGPATWWAILYLLWRGVNWARIIVIVRGIVGTFVILGLALPEPEIPANVQMAILDFAMSCVWLFVLLSRPAIAFTKGIPASS